MATIRVDIKDAGRVWERANAEVRERIHRGLVSGVLAGQKVVVEASPVDTGLYQASWDTRIKSPGNVQLGNSAPHAPVIEYGARPHRPPIGPLLAWAKRVLKDPSHPPNYSPEVWRLAVGTQKKIEQYGQAPRHVLTKAIAEIVKLIQREIKREVG